MKIKTNDYGRYKELMHASGTQSALDYLLGIASEYEQAPRSLRAPYCLLVGRSYSLLGNYAKADAYFDSSVGLLDHNYKAYFEMAESYIQRGDLPKAEKTLRELTENSSLNNFGFNQQLLLLTAKYSKLTGDYSNSKYLYEQYLKNSAPQSTVIKDVAFLENVLSRGSQGPQAIEGTKDYAFHLNRRTPRNPNAHDVAITFLNNRLKDLKQSDSRIEIQSIIAQFYLESGKVDLARKYNQLALDQDQNNARTLSTRIRLMIPSEAPEAVRTLFEKDGPLILRSPNIAFSLAKSFATAGFNDLTMAIATELATDRLTPYYMREQARLLLSERTQG